MPAITLGLAEVEERLRGLCRRLNAVTAQHSVYVTLSTLIAVLTGLIILGLRGTPDAFRVATWTGGALALAVATWGILRVRWRWVDVAAAAHLADRRAALTDRLTTLVDLRARPRPSRLAPVLVGQVLALSEQWHARRIVPRRIPRSIFALVAALLALGATAFVERRPPDIATARAGAGAAASQATGGALEKALSAAGGAATADGPTMPGVPPEGDTSRNQMADGHDAMNAPARDARDAGAPPQNAAGRGAGAKAPSNATGGDRTAGAQAGNALTALPDHLQDAIRRAFNAEAMDRPQQLAARSDSQKRNPSAGGSDPKENRGSERRDPSDAGKTGPSTQPSQKDAGAGAQQGPGKPKPGEQTAQRKDGNATQQNFEGNSPAAGNGSSPAALMAGKGEPVNIGKEGSRTFKLTITSFLHAMEQKGNQPRQSNKKAGTSSAAGSGGTAPVALNDRQLNDDALRKAEIPPEYEDIVRRVYSLKDEQ